MYLFIRSIIDSVCIWPSMYMYNVYYTYVLYNINTKQDLYIVFMLDARACIRIILYNIIRLIMCKKTRAKHVEVYRSLRFMRQTYC